MGEAGDCRCLSQFVYMNYKSCFDCTLLLLLVAMCATLGYRVFPPLCHLRSPTGATLELNFPKHAGIIYNIFYEYAEHPAQPSSPVECLYGLRFSRAIGVVQYQVSEEQSQHPIINSDLWVHYSVLRQSVEHSMNTNSAFRPISWAMVKRRPLIPEQRRRPNWRACLRAKMVGMG